MSKSRVQLLCVLLGVVALAGRGHVLAQFSSPAVSGILFPTFDIRLDKEEAPRGYLDKVIRADARAVALIDARVSGIARLTSELGEVTLGISPTLSTLEVVGTRPGGRFLTEAASDRPAALRAFLAAHGDAFSVSADDINRLELVADYENPAGNMAWTELEQRINGLPVFQGYIRGGFTAKGELAGTTGVLAPGLNPDALATSPVLTAADAISRAAASVGWNMVPAAFVAKPAAAGDQRVVFERGPMSDEPMAWPVYFPLTAGVARLAWATVIWGNPDVFLVLVDAEDGTLLFRKHLTDYQTQSGTYVIYNDDSPAPSSPTPALPGANYQAPYIARTSITLIGNEAPYTFNNLGWITDGGNQTQGNNVIAGIDRDGTNGVDTPITASSGRTFNFVYNPETDSPLTAAYQAGDVTNMFYWTNRFHDFTYTLGFTEAARNYQNDNFGRGGLGSDRVSAEGQDSSGTNNANFSTVPDGTSGRMQMYIWTGPTPDRSGDLDRDIIMHELTHGMSQRLHGNSSGLSSNMSRGMGEGWSDFYSRALTATADENVNGVYAMGGWVLKEINAGFTDNYYYGVRRFPYAVRSSVGSNGKPFNPLTFADIDSTQFNIDDGAYPRGPVGVSTVDQVHNMGEVWAAMLFEVRARFINRLGFVAGSVRILQFVTDGMKLDPLAPTMLQARDSIIAAANAGGGTAADIADIWAGFAARGLGTMASISNIGSGANNTRVFESFLTPSDPTPTFAISDVTLVEGNGGTRNAVFTVSLANPHSSPSAVSYETADGTATAVNATVTNASTITIPGSGTAAGVASPYPSNVVVSGVPGTIQRVTARLNSFTHTFPADVDILLVGPGGQKTILMSDVAGGNAASGINLTFRDGAPALTGDPLASGTYGPTDLTTGDTFAAPAPPGPYTASLAVFNGTDPNGTWSLYVVDDASADVGTISGFSLSIETGTNDYNSTNGLLTFSGGVTSRTITVTVNGDASVEGNEQFVVNLFGATNAVIGDSQGAGVILNDDGGNVPADITWPVAGSIITNPATFTWTAGSGALEYWLDVGTTPGGVDVYNASQGLSLSRFVSGIPSTGGVVYARLWTRFSGGWNTPVSYAYIGGSATLNERMALGLGSFAGNGGWIAMRSGVGDAYSAKPWTRLPWDAYNSGGGGSRVAAGDVDGDGLSELIVGLDTGGWIAVLDDAAHSYALLRWIQVPWAAYNSANGSVWPAVGDVDGDGRAEIVAGLGTGAQGWFAIFDDAAGSYALLGWRQVAWATYNAGASGATRPAVANLDGTGPSEIVIGLGPSGDGWIDIFSGSGGGYAHQSWIQVPWASYNSANGETFVAAGDVDGDGRGEIVAGLGAGGSGYAYVFNDAAASYAGVAWVQTSWAAFNASGSAVVYPAVGDIDGDGRAEIVLALGPFAGAGGWFELLNDSPAGFASLGWKNVGWSAFTSSGGGTSAAIGVFK